MYKIILTLATFVFIFGCSSPQINKETENSSVSETNNAPALIVENIQKGILELVPKNVKFQLVAINIRPSNDRKSELKINKGKAFISVKEYEGLRFNSLRNLSELKKGALEEKYQSLEIQIIGPNLQSETVSGLEFQNEEVRNKFYELSDQQLKILCKQFPKDKLEKLHKFLVDQDSHIEEAEKKILWLTRQFACANLEFDTATKILTNSISSKAKEFQHNDTGK